MTLSLYFARRFLVNFLRVLLAISLIIFLIDLLENIGDLTNGETPIRSAITLTLLRTPSFMTQAMPLIVMLASLAFCIGVARSSEFVISRAMGLSAMRSLLAPMVCAFGLGVFSIFAFQPFAGQLLDKYELKKDQIRGNQSRAVTLNETGYWMRQSNLDGHQVIKASSTSDNGRVLKGLTVYDYDTSGKIQSRIYAETGFLNQGEWVFVDGFQWDDEILYDNPELAKIPFGFKRISTDITPTQLLDGYPKPQSLSPLHLPAQIKIIASAGFSTLKYQSYQANQFARPFLFLVMMVIGAIFTLKTARQGGLGMAVLMSLIFGFSLHFLQNFANTLGSSGEIPLFLSAWAPILAAGLTALSLFLHFEDG